jgi:isopenicillin-N N-acyltransferase-like protein
MQGAAPPQPPRLELIETDALDPRERGLALGSALAGRVAAVLASYERMFALTRGLARDDLQRFGTSVLAAVARWRAPLVAELEGVADGAGQPVELIAMLNARTELTRMPECSVIGRVDGADGPWLAQNWDWYLDAPERCVVWSCAVEAGRLTTMTEAGLLAKVGLGARGVAVALNILHHPADGAGPVGVPVHLLLREILASCATVDDVAALAADARTSASSAVTVVDDSGGGATFELSPHGAARVAPADGLLLHTNHFLAPGLAGVEAGSEWLAGSKARLRRLADAGPDSLQAALQLLRGHDGPVQAVCRHDEPPEAAGLPGVGTVVALAARPAARSLAVSAGPPCTAALVPYA